MAVENHHTTAVHPTMPKSEDDARSKLVEAQRKAAQAVTAEEKRAAEEEVREAERQFMRMVHAK